MIDVRVAGWNRPSAVALGVVRLGFAAGLFVMLGVVGGCDRREALVSVESQREALEILVELENAGVVGAHLTTQSKSRREVQQISVPPEELGRARALLLQRDLPRQERGGLESFANGDGIIPSPGDERARLMHAIAGELERTLESIDGVSRARVHVVLPEKDALLTGDERKSRVTSAAVLLTVNWETIGEAGVAEQPAAQAADASRAGVEPQANFVVQRVAPGQAGAKVEQQAANLFAAVRSLVSRAVPGLEPESISVVASYAPTRTALSRQPNLAGQIAEGEQKMRVLFVGAVVISVLFLVTLGWGIWRGRRARDSGNGDGYVAT